MTSLKPTSKASSQTLRDALHASLPMILSEHPMGLSEFDLIKRLIEAPYHIFPSDCLRDSLALFQVHFALFHVLYQLRDLLHQEALGSLKVTAQNICVLPYQVGQAEVALPDPLRDYYLDWSHFERTGREDVERLLEDFWQGVRRPSVDQAEVEDALTLFQLPDDYTFAEAKRRYRRLAMEHHPDRGGDTEMLKKINAAMRVLAAHHGQ